MHLLVTGGCGFIGSNFIRHMLREYPSCRVVNLDALTYAGNPENLREVEKDERYTFVQGSIGDSSLVRNLIRTADAVVHFAAESHVDRSIVDVQPFLSTNVVGTSVLLQAAREVSLRRFIHISTDEVYGTLGDEGKFTEMTPLMPNSPYAASKASADLLVRAYHETYALPAIIVRPSNNYGPYQYPEKFIPLMITNLADGRPIPLYGEGRNVRDWLYVEDTCRAIDLIMRKGKDGEIYNVGGDAEQSNIGIARMILHAMGKDESFITFVKDRPGHDYRYALDIGKIGSELAWRPAVGIREGISRTIEWYRDNDTWWRPLKKRLSEESKGFWGG